MRSDRRARTCRFASAGPLVWLLGLGLSGPATAAGESEAGLSAAPTQSSFIDLTDLGSLPPAEPRDGELLPMQSVGGLSPRVVNGTLAAGTQPTVGYLYAEGGLCTGTMIGCQTFLTAAHCFDATPNPAQTFVFLQHAGIKQVSTITRHASYTGAIGDPHDFAVVRLTAPVTGIAPTRLSPVAEGGIPQANIIVGYGGIGDPSPANVAATGSGLLRTGNVLTTACGGEFDAPFICFLYDNASVSGACPGDSGGPLLDDGMVQGVASFVSSQGSNICLSPTYGVYGDVNSERAFITAQAVADLAPIQCGTTPPVPSAGTSQLVSEGTMIVGETFKGYLLVPPVGTYELRIALNGRFTPAQNYDLHADYDPDGAPPPVLICNNTNVGISLESCTITNGGSPIPPGTFSIYVDNPGGTSSGQFQLTATSFFGAPVPTWTPTATPTRTLTPTATPTRTSTPTASNTPSATATRTSTPSATATRTLTPTATFTASSTPTATATRTLTPTATATASATPTSTSSATHTATPTPTLTATATHSLTPTLTATRTPTATTTPTPTATATRTLTPTATATDTPTSTTTTTPTRTPTATTSVTSTSTPTATLTSVPGSCTPLDVDGNGLLRPLSDGVLLLRRLVGASGTVLTDGALGAGATRDAAQIVTFLAGCGVAIDVDGDGNQDLPTDGVLWLRYLFGLRGPTLVNGVDLGGCSRCTAELIEGHLSLYD